MKRSNARRNERRTWQEQFTLGFLLALTAMGLYFAAVYGLDIARGQLRWTYGFVILMLALCGMPVGFVWMLALRHKTGAWRRGRVAAFGVLWYALMLAFFAVPFSCWPLRLSFALEQAQFEAIAHRVERGEVLSTPLHIGVFAVMKAEKDSRGIVWLWINPYGNVSGKYNVLIHCLPEQLPASTILYPLGLNTQVKLSPRWHCLGCAG